MRRRIIIVAVFLLAGAVVNVAVAWGLWKRVQSLTETDVYRASGWELSMTHDLIGLNVSLGWPTLSLRGEVEERLSLRPIWPGFAVNTIFYAAVLWLLIPGPFVLRRYLRVRRGLCPKCAYPMGETDVCSECGMAVNRTSTS